MNKSIQFVVVVAAILGVPMAMLIFLCCGIGFVSRNRHETMVSQPKPQTSLVRFGEKPYPRDQQRAVTYYLNGPWSDDEFQEVYKQETQWPVHNETLLIAVFDKKENVSYPKDPPSAGYGVEFDKLRHIVAQGVHCEFNGFREMYVYHPSNAANGAARKLPVR